jgi:GntR family histidine utilization transcriptional repressor
MSIEDPRRYIRAMNFIRAKIENGTWKPHELMPPIGELAEQTGHSRHTISKAMRLLQDEGFVTRTPGLGYCPAAHAANSSRLAPIPAMNGYANGHR